MIKNYLAKRQSACGHCGEEIVKGEKVIRFGEYQYTHSFHPVCVLKVVCEKEVSEIVNKALGR